MNPNQLLKHYQEELAHMRQMIATYARDHPKIAERLRLGTNEVDDPQVARLIEAFSLSNAHLRHALEEEFPPISEALLHILHPHTLAPIPAMSIAQFEPHSHKMVRDKIIPANTLLTSTASGQQPCTFKTCYPVQIFPIAVTDAVLMGKPANTPVLAAAPGCPAILRLTIASQQPTLSLSAMRITKLRFFIQAPPSDAYALHYLLFQKTTAIALAASASDPAPLSIDLRHLRMVGLEESEGLLPYDKRTFIGYRLLSDFFALPEKFLFFDLHGLSELLPQKYPALSEKLELYFYFDHLDPILEKRLNSRYFALNCTPIVNLFDTQAAPIHLTHSKTAYPILATPSIGANEIEIYSVNQVTAVNTSGEQQVYQPFHGLTHDPAGLYYCLSRKSTAENGLYPSNGSDVLLSFSDTALLPLKTPENWQMHLCLTCTNRDLVEQIPLKDNHILFDLLEQKDTQVIAQIKSITPLTLTRRPFQHPYHHWRQISQLSLNYLSLTHDKLGISAFKDLLRVYDFDNSNEHKNILAGLLAIKSQNAFAHHPDAARTGMALWAGTEIILTIDTAKFVPTHPYLFCYVLSHFLAAYATTNLFTQLIVRTQTAELFRFPPIAGAKSAI